ncbi:DUF305 domain-containing protein [Pseudomonas alliivorans]|uniref:DUF305 domain-containing protein n=1 Tax=Pseudomonas cannabina pv. alisalensis TaxID=757414 RepID=A0ABS1X7U9_PSEC1|nr:DUF305 domain-containing protein [Pseudomonas cannabina]MEE4964489.1 DUF305 domain-containing protein [Pseudomonas alliivorans]MBM0137549.1 DUF305 domain-containing protein [Pseudomonas cannabina pv. alisalensis]MEE4974572.1 DUF305 domain-containing protein [Pseudomonas alliivorans]MEE4979721.1 DUF305 domain-containing protein [Pseudomonas alliivorans]MEE4984826.1 DUF305 domain-containing protein [Pseudomonas alliivorans]
MINKYLTCASFGSILFFSSFSLSYADNNNSHSEFSERKTADSMTAAGMDNRASADYKQAMEKMNKGMMSGMASDPSKSWAQMMVEHHQGAIDMSKIVLKNTQDPAIKQMAEKSIKEQSTSIAELKSWLSKH